MSHPNPNPIFHTICICGVKKIPFSADFWTLLSHPGESFTDKSPVRVLCLTKAGQMRTHPQSPEVESAQRGTTSGLYCRLCFFTTVTRMNMQEH